LMVGGVLVAVPAAGVAVLSVVVASWWGWLALIIGPALGLVAVWFAARLTADRYLEQSPEILAVVSVGDRV